MTLDEGVILTSWRRIICRSIGQHFRPGAGRQRGSHQGHHTPQRRHTIAALFELQHQHSHLQHRRQTLVNARRALGQNVFVADTFSAVDPATGLQGDKLQPNTTGLTAIAKEFLARINASTFRTAAPSTYLIPGCSDWRYSDEGLDLGTNWTLPHYDDSAWNHGAGTPWITGPPESPQPLATVPPRPTSTSRPISAAALSFLPASTTPTSTSASTARTAQPSGSTGGIVPTRSADGTGTLGLDLATRPAVNDGIHAYYQTDVAVTFLPPGTNVLAVEIHKYAPQMASLSFDLELFGMGDYPPPNTTALG